MIWVDLVLILRRENRINMIVKRITVMRIRTMMRETMNIKERLENIIKKKKKEEENNEIQIIKTLLKNMIKKKKGFNKNFIIYKIYIYFLYFLNK